MLTLFYFVIQPWTLSLFTDFTYEFTCVINMLYLIDSNYHLIVLFSMVMVIYHRVERIGEFSLPLNILHNIYDNENILSWWNS